MGWGPKVLCTKNGPIGFSRLQMHRSTMVTLVRGGGGVLLRMSAVLM